MRLMKTLMAGLATIAVLLASGVAHAANYTFPGSMPAGCSGSAGNYSCGALTLGYGDTITIANPKPATITVNGALYTDTSTINASGAASDLNLIVTGPLTTNYRAVLNANVTAASVDASGGGTEVKYGGSLTGTSGTINLGYQTTVSGAIQAGGSISLGQESVVSGSVTGATGQVNVGYAARVTGAITTSSGAISFAQSSVASGCVTSTGSAPITLGYQASVAGVCCGASCSNSCVVNNSTYAMPAACTVPAVTLSKTASASSAQVGDVVTFTITATNSYAQAISNVAIADVLPAGMSYSTHVATLGAVTVNGQNVSWSIPEVPANGSAQLILAVSLSAQGVLTNTVTSTGATSASASILVLANAVTHFRFDEPVGAWAGATGEVIDSGNTALHGRRLTTTSPTVTNTVSPNPTIASQYASVVGGFCNAGSFDGRGVVQVTDSPLFDYTNKLSASAWIYPTAYPTSDLYSILSNDQNYEFHLNTAGRLYWWWNASSLTSAATIPLNRWTHIAITFSSAAGARRQRIYINGVADANTNNWTGTLANNACPFYIGGDITTGAACSLIPGRNFRGRIDEVKLYDFELSASEVQADMNLGRQCSGTFDHIRIEHDGVASICAPETVTVKACLDAACSTLYGGNVTVNLSPPGWSGGDTFTFSGGIASRQLNYGTAGNVTLGTVSVSPGPANATRCFKGATETCTMNFAASSCSFDAVEPGANPQTRLFTKLAGVPFSVDVLALSSASTINTSYTGTVAVDLVDASTSACPTGTGLNTAQDVKYVGGNKGRKTVAFTYNNAARNVRVRAKVGSGSPACSTDSFAVRPQIFTSITSSANVDSAGTNAMATPVTKAGSAFSLTANTGVVGYDGNPKADPSLIEWLNVPAGGRAAPGTGTLDGSTAGSPVFSTAALATTGNGATGSFTYDEAGYFRFKANGVYDDTFTVDSGDKLGTDCVVGSLSNTAVGGKYGCGFGNASPTSYFGRFIPDHFDTSVAQGCVAGGFTYSGQPFPLTISARNLAGGAVANYSGAYARQVSLTARDAADTGDNPGAGSLSLADVAALAFSGGVANANPSYAFTDQRTAQTAVRVRASEAEVTSLRSPTSLTVEGSASILSGRARIANAYGSELLDLPVIFRTESWDGSGWVLNTQDSCTGDTTLDANNAVSVALTPSPAALPTCIYDTGDPGLSGAGCPAAAAAARQFEEGATPTIGFAGDFNLWLSAPGAGNFGTALLNATVPAWLGVVPPAMATFGQYKTPLIYRREAF